jgi:hypothetical protein
MGWASFIWHGHWLYAYACGLKLLPLFLHLLDALKQQ